MILAVAGWLLWTFTSVFALSGLFSIMEAARTRGSVTHMGLFQFASMLALAIVFVATDWNKLHLAWLIPVCWIASFTWFGMTIGRAVGVITLVLFGRE